MTSVEKRRSGRKNGGHRKHSDGGYSDTSSGGSFLDETDREVSNLTDRAFRSLCIGDEAVYNDSDLSSSSPYSQKDRQRAFRQDGQDRVDGERGELKRAAHESLSLRTQQTGQDWFHEGMYGTKIQREVYGERTQGRVSATFQHSFLETSQQQESLKGEQMSIHTNGATELSSQHQRSRSRVSSLIRAFNSEGNRDGTATDGHPREWDNDTSWDKSALMSIQRELCEFSTSYQQNLNSGHLPSTGMYSSQDTNFYPPDAAAVAHMNSDASFIRSAHSKHTMSAQVNCGSNFFIHSEFSPFKVWRDHNRFPLQQGHVSGFMHCSEVPKFYETPMYKNISLEDQPQGPYMTEETGIKHLRNNLAPVAPNPSSRSTSTSTVLQKALAVEKRCESESAGQYPHRKPAQSLGTKRIPSNRPSTASPTIEMSHRVQDTISSVKALQQKIKMMTEQNTTPGVTVTQHGELCGTDKLIPFDNNVGTVASTNTNKTPFSISQLLAPSVFAHQEVETSKVKVSPQPMEQPPVRTESRGATLDVRMSSYKSRATSLLFNLKDNRKRVKSTYSPTKFKGLETQEKNKHQSCKESRDFVIDIPDFSDPEINYPQEEESSHMKAASKQFASQYHNPGPSLTTQNSQPATLQTGQYSQFSSLNYQPAQKQSEMVHHPEFTIPENYINPHMADGQNLQHHLFSPYKEGLIEKTETLGDDYSFKHNYYTPSEMSRLRPDNNQTRVYLKYRENSKQSAMETVERDFEKVDKYQLLKNNSYYSNESSQDMCRQTSNEDTENVSLVKAIAPSKQVMSASMDKERAATIDNKETFPRDKYRAEENQQYTNKELKKMEQQENFSTGTSHKNAGFVNSNVPFTIGMVENAGQYGQQQHEAFQGKQINPNYYTQNKGNEKKDNNSVQDYNRSHNSHESLYTNKDTNLTPKETVQKNLNSKEQGMQVFPPKEEFEHIIRKKTISRPGNAFEPTAASRLEHGQSVEVDAGHLKAQNNHAELGKIPHFVEQSKLESGRILLARQSGEKEPREEVWPREEETKTKQTREETVTEEQYIFTEQIRAEHTGQSQGEVKKLKEEPIHPELLKPEHARTQQTKMEVVRGERIEADQLEEEQVGGGVEREQMEAEPIGADNVTAEQSKAETDKLVEIKEQRAKSEQTHKEVEDESVQACQIYADQITTLMNKAKEEEPKDRKDEQAKSKQTKGKLAQAGDTETEKVKEMLAKTAIQPSESQQVRVEPDKVEQVKTELAKAKAELAKIKEKIGGEQKDKVRNPPSEKDFPFSVNVDKNEESKDQEQETQMHQQVEEPVLVSRENTYQVIVGAYDYERLREKYGLTETTPTNRNKLSGTEKSASNNNNETPILSSDKVETINKTQSKEKYSPTNRLTPAYTENKEAVNGFEPNKVTETHSVSSDSSRYSKLGSADYLHSNTDRAHSNPSTDIVKDDTVEILEKFDPKKMTDVSQQRESNLAKSIPTERKPKSTEHSGGQDNEPGFTPNRTLSHKERAQTKQEILTSKIKAHAEKEISAIKERGFAISKTSTKQSAGSQNINIQQRPPLQEDTKNHERTISSNTTIKPKIEPQGIQTEPIMSVSPPSSATAPVKPGATSSYIVDHKQKHLPIEPMKVHNNMPRAPTEANQTASFTTSIEDPKKEKHTEIEPLVQSMEEAPIINQGKQEESKGQISGDKKETLPVINADHVSKKGEDAPQAATALVEAENSSPLMIEKTEGKHTSVFEDLAPPPIIDFCQDEPSVTDDSLQIMGIMVSVQERKTFMSAEQEIKDSSRTQVDSRESSDLEFDKSHPSSGLEESKGNVSSNDVCQYKLNTVAQNTHSKVKEAQTEVDESYLTENVHESSALETTQNNVSVEVTMEKATYQQESPCNEHFSNTRLQRETKHKGPSGKKAASSTDSVPAGASTETPQFVYKHERIAEKEHTNKNTKENSEKTIGKDAVKNNNEEKNTHIRQMADTSEKFIGKIVSPGPNPINDSNGEHTESLMKYDAQPSVKDDMIMIINPLKSRSTDGKVLLLQDNKRHDSKSPGPCNKISPSNHFPENKNIDISPKYQPGETENVANKQMDTNVHIGSIAIRVVSGINDHKDNLEMVRKQVPSNVATGNDHIPQATSNENTSHSEDQTKDLPPAGSEKHIKDTVDYKSEVQHVLSSVKKLSDSLKISHQQNTISEKTQPEHGKAENRDESGKSVEESKMQPTESDYFQLQDVVDSNKSQNRANVVDPSDAPLQVRKGPGLVSNKAAINNDSYDECKNKTAMDASKMKAVESCSVSVQDESSSRKNRGTEDHLADRQSGKNEKRETSQMTSNSKQHKENQSSMSAKERHTSQNPRQTRDNLVKEKPEVKAKPKERASTIPEISALADYARLKVIVSEEPENTIQEFPPSKKEGFFPLIQSRHSRRPVFTVDPPDMTVRGKSFPNKTEMRSKVNKEPKPLVFPITDKEHQRTGMFKLGDKERHEKIFFDAKSARNVLDNAKTKHAQHLKDRHKFLTNHPENHRSEKDAGGTNIQADHQSNIPPLQAASSLAANRPRKTNLSQHLNSSGESNPHGEPEECSSKAERTPYSPSKSTEESQQTTVKNNEKIKDTLAKTENERLDKQRQEMPEAQHEESTVNPSRIKQMEKDLISRIEGGGRVEDNKIIHMIEESKASLAEEERRAAQREEERRAGEREAIALEIRERREKQRKAERRAEEERKTKQTEGENAAEKEMMTRAKQEVRTIEDSEEKRRIKIPEERSGKLSEETNAHKEEEQRRSTREEQRLRAVQDDQQRRAAKVEQHRRAAMIEEQRRRAILEEKQRKAAQEEQQRRASQEEQQRRAAQEEQQRRAAQEEQQRRAALIEEQQRRAAVEETPMRAVQEEQLRRATLVEKQRGAKQNEEKIVVDSEQERKGKPKDAMTEVQKDKPKREELLTSQREEEERGVVEKEKTMINNREERTRHPEVEVENSVAKEHMLPQEEDEFRGEEKLAPDREKEKRVQIEEQKRAAQRLEALQYYSITSTESDRKPRAKQICSPSPSQQRKDQSGPESPEDSHTRPHGPQTPESPAPSLPRSDTSSPALGTKPSMFRVKDNTIRGSSLTRSVKPRFHKNFAEDFRVGSPMGSERGEDERGAVRHSAMPPLHLDTGSNRHAAIREYVTSSSQDYSAPLSHPRPYTRRSIALDDDDCRSVFSNMSEDVESFATSAADLADVRGLYDYERPESACSFSSDVSRTLGKPPVVPPKSDKALRRAKRLTTRRIKKELSKAVGDNPSLQEVSNKPSSSSSEVLSFSRHAVASPHFTPPVSLAHAPAVESNLSACHTESPPSHSAFYASPHATGPVCLPAASPHADAPLSLPVASPHAAGLAYHPATPETIADIPSSPTLYHANNPAPVTQYHVESSYPQPYPLTQRKVLQDLGSGQYFVVDVPVQVKMKTFFDPETGKYVQLNVRESAKSTSKPQPQPPPQMHLKPQQQPLSQDPPAGKPLFHCYPQGHQLVDINSVPHSRSSAPVTLHQDQQPVMESHSSKHPATETVHSSKGYHYSPEKTPYMDTVTDSDKTCNTVYNSEGPRDSPRECDTNSHFAGSSVCENCSLAHSRYHPRDIITMGELEDFMELSDW